MGSGERVTTSVTGERADGRATGGPAADLAAASGLRWLRLRLVLAVLWSAVAVAVLLLSPRQVPAGDLLLAVQEGRVDSVVVVGGLEPGSQGWSQVEVRWRELGLPRQATFVEERPGEVVGEDGLDDGAWDPGGWSTDGEGRPVVLDVPAEIRSYSADVQVREQPWPTGVTVFGVPAPGWVGVALLLAWLLTVWLLVEGPQPWRATRWAWFWLGAVPFGLLAFVLLSGPLRGPLRGSVEPAGRRLTGGWALLLSMVLSGVLPAPLWW